MLATSTESSPHEKEMQKEENTAEDNQAPRHGGANIIGICKGGSLVPGVVIGLLGSPLEKSPHDRADYHRSNTVGGEPEAVSYTHLTLPTNREV